MKGGQLELQAHGRRVAALARRSLEQSESLQPAQSPAVLCIKRGGTLTLAYVIQETHRAVPSWRRTSPDSANMGLHTRAVSSVPTMTMLREVWWDGWQGEGCFLCCLRTVM